MPTCWLSAHASSMPKKLFAWWINGWARSLPGGGMSAAWKRSWPSKRKKTPPGRHGVTDEGPLMHHLWSSGDYEISTDPARVDAGLVHEFLTNSYWAKGIPLATVRRSIENSVPFGVYHGQQLV